MHSKMRKIFALLLIFVMVLGTTPPITFAEPTSPYLASGNDMGGSTIFYLAPDKSPNPNTVFKSMVGYQYVKFNVGGGTESSDSSYVSKITLNVTGNSATWSSEFPIAYIYTKTGNINGTPYLFTNGGAQNSGGYLYEYPAGTKSGSIIAPEGKGISHVVFFFEIPPVLGKINVTKTLDPQGETPSTNVDFTFKLYKSTAPDVVLNTLTLKVGETKSFNDLPLGTYIVKEDLTGLSEYSIVSTSQEVTLTANTLSPTLTFMNKYVQKKYEITVNKTVTPLGEYRVPSGQIFKFQLIRKSDNHMMQEITIDYDQTHTGKFNPVPAGEYYVKEVTPLPAGFSVVANDLPVIVNETNGDESVSFTNNYEKDKFNISVKKKIELQNPGTIPIEETFTFELWAVGGTSPIETVTIKGEGTAQFKPVFEGEYYIVEKTPSEHYEVDENNLPVVVNANNPAEEVEFINYFLTYKVQVEKMLSMDSDSPVTTGDEFEFGLFKESDLTTPISTVSIEVGETGTFAPVPAGKYVVKEIDMPSGYELVPFSTDPDVFEVKITLNPRIQLEPIIFINKYTRLYEIYVYKSLGEDTYENGPARSEFSVLAVLPSFEFVLYNVDDPANPVEIDRKTIQAWSGTNFKPVPEGLYKVVEVDKPDNYQLYRFPTDPETPFDINPDQPGYEIVFNNRYIEEYEVIVNKELTGGGPNSVFTFRLYKRVVDEVGVTEELIEEITITGAGQKSFAPVLEGEYFVREVNIPGIYLLIGGNDKPVVFGENNVGTVTFRNNYETTETTGTTETTETTETTGTTGTTETTVTTETTESTEEITTESVPLGSSEEELELVEEIPLGPALPQTGQVSADLFYGIGGLISAIGVYIRRRK